jgi:hypothetical protein
VLVQNLQLKKLKRKCMDEEDRNEFDVPVSFLSLHLPTLKANNIDVYHGHFDDGSFVISAVEGAIEHIDVDGISKEVNNVKCLNLKPVNMLSSSTRFTCIALISIHQ